MTGNNKYRDSSYGGALLPTPHIRHLYPPMVPFPHPIHISNPLYVLIHLFYFYFSGEIQVVESKAQQTYEPSKTQNHQLVLTPIVHTVTRLTIFQADYL